MFKRLLYYGELARRDLLRFKSASCLQALIVAGVCFPILVLLALKRGHVEELRRELVTSPTGRLVKIYPAAAGRPFTRTELLPLARELGNVEFAIPNVRRVVELSNDNGASMSADIYATCPGDPILKTQNADVLLEGEDALVVNSIVAEALQLNVGTSVTVTVTRATDNQKATTRLVVKAIVPTSSKDKLGFVDMSLIDWISVYQRNGAVQEWNWPALAADPTERYPSFLLVNDATDPLKPVDFDVLSGQGFSVERVSDESASSLAGAIRPESRGSVVVYRLTRPGSQAKVESRMSDKWFEIGTRTLATDAIIPWCEPRSFDYNGRQFELVGITLPPRCQWLREMLLSSSLPFDRNIDYPQCRDDFGIIQNHQASVPLPIGTDAVLPLTISRSQISEDTQPIASAESPADALQPDNLRPPHRLTLFCPSKLLAFLDEHDAGLASFDSASQRFTGVVSAPTYEDALLFAATIDDVPQIVANAVSKGFPFNAENARIEEIQKQDGSLQKLVLIVGMLVFSFGVFTVFGVLWESTARKRSTIGIMRVMGVTPVGAFLMVLFRALMLGALAGVLTIAAGWLSILLLTWHPPHASALAQWKPVVSAIIIQRDILLVLVGSIMCCAIGSFAPGIAASRLDPFDALVQGRFR